MNTGEFCFLKFVDLMRAHSKDDNELDNKTAVIN